MRKAIADLLSSRKFITAIVAVAVCIGARYGLELDPELVASLLGVFAILIHAQGSADHGKVAAQIAANTNTVAVVANSNAPKDAVVTVVNTSSAPPSEPSVIVTTSLPGTGETSP